MHFLTHYRDCKHYSQTYKCFCLMNGFISRNPPRYNPILGQTTMAPLGTYEIDNEEISQICDFDHRNQFVVLFVVKKAAESPNAIIIYL